MAPPGSDVRGWPARQRVPAPASSATECTEGCGGPSQGHDVLPAPGPVFPGQPPAPLPAGRPSAGAQCSLCSPRRCLLSHLRPPAACPPRPSPATRPLSEARGGGAAAGDARHLRKRGQHRAVPEPSGCSPSRGRQHQAPAPVHGLICSRPPGSIQKSPTRSGDQWEAGCTPQAPRPTEVQPRSCTAAGAAPRSLHTS